MAVEASIPDNELRPVTPGVGSELSDGDRAWRRMRRDNAQKAYILENIHSPVVTFCPQGRVRWVNRGFERLLGFRYRELLGKTYVDLVSAMVSHRQGESANPAQPVRAAARGNTASTQQRGRRLSSAGRAKKP